MSRSGLRRPDPSELALADRIEAVLRAASVVYERSHHETEDPLEPHVDFRPSTRPEHRLEVELVIGSDQLAVFCNEVGAFLPSVAFYEEEEWMRTCVGAIDYLVRHDLRLKIWSGAFTTVGAVRLGPSETDWAGELRAVSRGRERVFADWLEREADSDGDDDTLLTRVRAIVGTEDVERLDVVPELAFHDGERLHPVEAIRIQERYFIRTGDHGERWWMGELDDTGTIRAWGVHGATLVEAVRHH